VLPELLAAWCSGYRRRASLDAVMMAEIPTFVVLRRILLSAWLASHAEVPFAQERGATYTEGTVALAEQLLQGRFLRGA
jgi:Ser/Thr protein kinase RdoA (MazF antagonist)